VGTKSWMLFFADGDIGDALRSHPSLDRARSESLVRELFPQKQLEYLGEVNLAHAGPPRREVYAGCFDGLSVVAAHRFGMDYPSKLPAHFLQARYGRNTYLFAAYSIVDWFAFAHWQDGKLQRSLSLSADGIKENLGERKAFEEAYWRGDHPVDTGDSEAYSLPFHPLDLAECTAQQLFGFPLQAHVSANLIDPETVPLLAFRDSKAWWQFW